MSDRGVQAARPAAEQPAGAVPLGVPGGCHATAAWCPPGARNGRPSRRPRSRSAPTSVEDQHLLQERGWGHVGAGLLEQHCPARRAAEAEPPRSLRHGHGGPAEVDHWRGQRRVIRPGSDAMAARPGWWALLVEEAGRWRPGGAPILREVEVHRLLSPVDGPHADRRAGRRAPECRSWLEANLPWEYGRGSRPSSTTWPGSSPSCGLAEPAYFRRRPGRSPGPRPTAGGAPVPRPATWCRRSWPGHAPRAGRAHRHQPGRAHPAGPRHRRAKAALAARSAPPTRCSASSSSEPGAGSRSRGVAHSGRAGGRRLAARRPEGLDLHAQFADYGLCLARTDPDAPCHKGTPGRRHAPIGRRVRPHPGDRRGRVQRGLLRRRLRLRGEPRRRRARRVARVVVDPTHEAGHQPPPAHVIHAQHLEELLRLALEQGVYDDPRPAAPRPGLRRGAPVPAPHWLALPARARPGARPEGSVKLWSEMSQRLHETAMAVLGDGHQLWWAPPTTPATGAGSGRGSTTRRRRSSPAPTRSSATSSASGSGLPQSLPSPRPRGERVGKRWGRERRIQLDRIRP